MQTLKSTEAMAKAMAGATKAMGQMNKRMNLPALHNIMKEFEKQNAKMDQVEEMMGDAMDDVFEVRTHIAPSPSTSFPVYWVRGIPL